MKYLYILTIVVVMWIASGAEVKKVKPLCDQAITELNIVTDIAESTGRLPGDPKHYEPGTKFIVDKARVCGVSTKNRQFTGEQLQGSQQNLQQTANPQN